MTVVIADLIHEPLAPPRPTFIGECVFAEFWKAAMTAPLEENWRGEDVYPIDRVLSDCAHPTTQRDASILASVACWLGTNCGQSILHQAEHRLIGIGADRYIMAWAAENARKRGTNRFRRTIEALGRNDVDMEFTADDLEAIDSMMIWLSTHEGQEYLKAAQAEDQRRRAERDREQQRLWREANFPTRDVA